MKMDKVYSLLGLAVRSRNVVTGNFSTEKAVKSRQACMVIVAEDASLNTRKMFQNMCSYYQVPLYFYADKERLGHSIGKQYRASLAVVDEGFSKSLESKLKMLEKTE